MKSKEAIEKRRNMFEALAKETQSKIDKLEIEIEESQSNFKAASLTRQKEKLEKTLTVANSQWVELSWVLDK